MEIIGLVSGGKDSVYNLLECARMGHRIVALANVYPTRLTTEQGSAPDDVDSFMFQTVGCNAIPAIAQCMGLPLIRRETAGKATDTSLLYDQGANARSTHGNSSDDGTSADEVEDLYQLLKECKEKYPSAQGVSVGAILSNYQRARVEAVCARPDVGLVPIAFLWQRSQARLLQEMCSAGVDAILVKTATYGLGRSHLGLPLSALLPALLSRAQEYGLNPAGEGGEYESLARDCPQLYTHGKLLVQDSVILGPVGGGLVCHLHVKSASVGEKSADEISGGRETLAREQELAREAGWGGILPTLPAPFKGTGRRMGSVSLASLPRPPTPYGPSPQALEQGGPSTPPPASGISARVSMAGEGGYTVQLSMHTFMGQIHVGGLHCPGRTHSRLAVSAQQMAGEQTTACLGALDEVLRARGSHLADACFVHLYLTSMSHFHAVNEAYCAWFGAHPPARSAVTMRKPAPSAEHEVLVMMDVCVQTGSGWAVRAGKSEHRSSLHVATLSKWAPLCIGPYCQANVLSGCLLLPAGQIGMRPETVALVPGGPHSQLIQALCSLSRVLGADTLSSALPHALAFTLYVSWDIVVGQGEGNGDVLLAALTARTQAWMMGAFGTGVCLTEEVRQREEDSGRVRLDDTEDFGGEDEHGGYAGLIAHEIAPLPLPGLDDAEECMFSLAPTAHTPPSYVTQAGHGLAVAEAQARAVREAQAAGACSTVRRPYAPPVLPPAAVALLPLQLVLVPSLPRGAAVEVETWAVSAHAEALLGGIQAQEGELQEGLHWAVHWLPRVALSAVATLTTPTRDAASELVEACTRACLRAAHTAGLPPAALMHVRGYALEEGSEGMDWQGAIAQAWAAACEGHGHVCPAITVVVVPSLARLQRGGAKATLSLHFTGWDSARAGAEMWLRKHYAQG